MSKKALRITSSNQNQIRDQYQNFEESDELPVGMYILSDFGWGAPAEIVTTFNLERNFVRTGKKLKNGYFEVVAKGGPEDTNEG